MIAYVQPGQLVTISHSELGIGVDGRLPLCADYDYVNSQLGDIVARLCGTGLVIATHQINHRHSTHQLAYVMDSRTQKSGWCFAQYLQVV